MAFINWVNEYGRSYGTKAEFEFRFKQFQKTMQKMAAHNANEAHGSTVGLNAFSDYTEAEWGKMLGYKAEMRNSTKSPTVLDTVGVADSIDWRDRGAVSPVKNQGQCGSCWAFSTTGSLEGQHFKKTGKLVSLSEQNLVDCSAKTGNQGCNGGLMDQAFKYIKENAGIDTEASYPYEGKDGSCRFQASNVGATDTGYVDVQSKDEQALKQAVGINGPVSVAIDASHVSFQLYSHGVYHQNFCSETRLDHGVLVVGYGTESSADYWLVKNSWGASWGEEGYIKMSRNRRNNCGIASSASYPLV